MAVYARVSTVEQARGYSLPEQVEELRRHCDRRGGRIVRLLCESESGGTLERPKVERLLAAAERGAYDILLVWRVDRISRSNLDLQALWSFFKSLDVAIASATEPFDATTTAGKTFFDFLALMAETERNTIRERAAMGARGRAKEGKWHGGPTPHGYAYDSASGRLCVDPIESALVQRIAALVMQHRTLESVVRVLKAEGTKTRTGRTWSKPVLSRMIRNPLYVGVLRVKDVVVQDVSLRILDDETFAALQRLRQDFARHRIAAHHRPAGSRVPDREWCVRCGCELAGVRAYCSNCGAAQWTPADEDAEAGPARPAAEQANGSALP
ncbi:MAG TPA: recombinase family protein [Thermoplasmata archaeon]|nr:recombinase family protein [Thermoplasmata archaeon]